MSNEHSDLPWMTAPGTVVITTMEQFNKLAGDPAARERVWKSSVAPILEGLIKHHADANPDIGAEKLAAYGEWLKGSVGAAATAAAYADEPVPEGSSTSDALSRGIVVLGTRIQQLTGVCLAPEDLHALLTFAFLVSEGGDDQITTLTE